MDTTCSWMVILPGPEAVDNINKDLGFDNGDKAVLLADTGVADQAICGRVTGLVDGGGVSGLQSKTIPP